MFDWPAFLDSRGIFYATSGPNVATGHIAVHCPFCGPADPSQHMSISLKGRGWKCWRNAEHRGKGAARLIQHLAGVSYQTAHEIAGTSVSLPGDFMSTVMGHVSPKKIVKPKRLTLPDEFKRIDGKRSGRAIFRYLTEDRGFTESQVLRLSKDYGLRYAMTGPQRYRVVFPVWFEGQLVSWTGRTIGDAIPRYKTLGLPSEDYEGEYGRFAMGALPDYLLFYDMLKERPGDAICLCEGPFDALKVCVLGERDKIDATCFFTAKPSARQIELLHELLPRYPKGRRFLVLDRGTLSTSLKLAAELSSLGVIPKEIPKGHKDPGDLSHRKQLLRLIDA